MSLKKTQKKGRQIKQRKGKTKLPEGLVAKTDFDPEIIQVGPPAFFVECLSEKKKQKKIREKKKKNEKTKKQKIKRKKKK